MHNIVFVDRDSLVAKVRAPSFAHTWTDHAFSEPQQVAERLADATIAISNKAPVTADTLAQLPKLQLIAVAATGTNNIDLAACKARGIVVSNIRNYSVVSVPEHCLAMILSLRRNLRAYLADVDAGLWQKSKNFCLLDHPIGDLAGSRLGIVGYGVLGQEVARLGRAFGMKVSVVARSEPDDADVEVVTLEEMLRTCDVVSLHLPLSEQTRHMIGAAELAQMRPGAILINSARGGLVDEAALAKVLASGAISAGFDVLTQEPPPADHPLLALRLPNFILTPHVAWASGGAMQTLADMLVDNLEAFVSGQPINVVT